jgi:hypothetical protein
MHFGLKCLCVLSCAEPKTVVPAAAAEEEGGSANAAVFVVCLSSVSEFGLTKDGKVVVVEALGAVRPCRFEPVPRLQQPTDPHVPAARVSLELSASSHGRVSKEGGGRNATAKRL